LFSYNFKLCNRYMGAVRKCRIPKRAAKYWGPLLLASLEQVDDELDESVSSCGSASAVSAVRLFSSRRVRPCGPFISADTLQVKTWRTTRAAPTKEAGGWRQPLTALRSHGACLANAPPHYPRSPRGER
jgi:hypothetical protein